MREIFVRVAAILAIGFGVWFASKQQSETYNPSPTNDQPAYINFARWIEKTNFDYWNDTCRQPLYPLLLTLVINPEKSEVENFPAAKEFSFYLSLVLLGALGTFFVSSLGWHAGLNATASAAFGIFAFRAHYVLVEPLFFTILFFVFVLQWNFLQGPNFLKSISLGFLWGGAFLSKATSILGILVFLGFFYFLFIIRFLFKNKIFPDFLNVNSKKFLFFYPLVSCFVFVFSISPYLNYNYKKFGKPLYNINTYFYMWMDSWKEAKNWAQITGAQTQYPQLPKEELPSFRRYWTEKGFLYILNRILTGISRAFYVSIHSWGWATHLAVLGAIVALLVFYERFQKREKAFAFDWKSNQFFIILYALIWLTPIYLSAAWWMKISASPRFVQGIYLPILFLFFYAIQKLTSNRTISLCGKNFELSKFTQTLISFFLVLDAIDILLRRSIEIQGGS